MRAVVDGHAAGRVDGADVAFLIEAGFGPALGLKSGLLACRIIFGTVSGGVGGNLAAARASHNDGRCIHPLRFGFGCWRSAARPCTASSRAIRSARARCCGGTRFYAAGRVRARRGAWTRSCSGGRLGRRLGRFDRLGSFGRFGSCCGLGRRRVCFTGCSGRRLFLLCRGRSRRYGTKQQEKGQSPDDSASLLAPIHEYTPRRIPPHCDRQGLCRDESAQGARNTEASIEPDGSNFVRNPSQGNLDRKWYILHFRTAGLFMN